MDELLLVLICKQHAGDVGDIHLDAVLAVVKGSKTPRVLLRSGRKLCLDVTDEVALALVQLIDVSGLHIGSLRQCIRELHDELRTTYRIFNPINTKAVITENIHDLRRSHRQTVAICAPRITLDGFGSASHGLFLGRSFVACLTTAQRRKQRRENHRQPDPSSDRSNPSHLRSTGRRRVHAARVDNGLLVERLYPLIIGRSGDGRIPLGRQAGDQRPGSRKPHAHSTICAPFRLRESESAAQMCRLHSIDGRPIGLG